MQTPTYINFVDPETKTLVNLEVNDEVSGYNTYGEFVPIIGLLQLRAHDYGSSYKGATKACELLLVESYKGFNVKKLSVSELQSSLREAIGESVIENELHLLKYHIQQNLASINPRFDPYKRYEFLAKENIMRLKKYKEVLVSLEEEEFQYELAVIRGEIYGI